MFVIGELINGMFKNVAKAIQEKDKAALQKIALDQVNAGADALDINCGPASKNPLSDMPWMVESIQEVTDKMLVLDSSKPAVIEAGLSVAKNKTMINSTTADKEKMDILIPLAKKYNSNIIGLAMSSKGIPRDKNERLELAATIVATCAEYEFPFDNLYLDPIVMPVNVSQQQLIDILEAIKEFKIISDPAPKTVVGLSNISQGTKQRPIINRTFLVMALHQGVDAAIVNPLDTDLMDAMITAELILNKNIYCESFLTAYRKK